MKIIIEAVGITLTPSLRYAVEDKMGHLDKFFKRNDSVELRIELSKPSAHHKKGNIFYAEANLNMKGGLLRATAENQDMHLAIDGVRHILEQQVVKRKDKEVSSHRRKISKRK